jgi:hypothetical protein
MADKLPEGYEWYSQSPKEFRQELLAWYSGIPRVIVGLVVVLLVTSIAVRLKREPDALILETIFDNLESIALGSAGIIFLLEAKDRQKRDHYEAWQVINLAQGQAGSGGRIQALQDLNRDGVDLEGVDVSGADLSGIDLRGANLKHANFSHTQLDNANLQEACLDHADFRKANLREANLRDAVLCNTKLENANLSKANLQNAHLFSVTLSGAFLWKTNLKGCLCNKMTRDETAVAWLCQTSLPNGSTNNRDCGELEIDSETGEFIDVDLD